MLKPKKKITRKEIARDPFLETIFSAREHLKQNQRRYTQISLGILAVVILSILYLNSAQAKKSDSVSALGKAMVYIDLGDHENTLLHLQGVVDEYEGTPAGIQAHYYLGRIHFDQDEFSSAAPLFQVYIKKGKNPILKSAAYEAMAHIQMTNGDLSQAVQYQEMAVKTSQSGERSAMAHLKLADLEIQIGDMDKAKSRVDKILNEWEDHYDLKQKAEELSGRLYVGDDS